MLRIYQGDTFSRTWPVSQDGLPITDFAGWAARAEVRETPESPTVLWSWATGGSDGLITLAASGVRLAHTAEQSAAFAWRLGGYDIKLIDPAGEVAWIARGRTMVIPAYTH